MIRYSVFSNHGLAGVDILDPPVITALFTFIYCYKLKTGIRSRLDMEILQFFLVGPQRTGKRMFSKEEREEDKW